MVDRDPEHNEPAQTPLDDTNMADQEQRLNQIVGNSSQDATTTGHEQVPAQVTQTPSVDPSMVSQDSSAGRATPNACTDADPAPTLAPTGPVPLAGSGPDPSEDEITRLKREAKAENDRWVSFTKKVVESYKQAQQMAADHLEKLHKRDEIYRQTEAERKDLSNKHEKLEKKLADDSATWQADREHLVADFDRKERDLRKDLEKKKEEVNEKEEDLCRVEGRMEDLRQKHKGVIESKDKANKKLSDDNLRLETKLHFSEGEVKLKEKERVTAEQERKEWKEKHDRIGDRYKEKDLALERTEEELNELLPHHDALVENHRVALYERDMYFGELSLRDAELAHAEETIHLLEPLKQRLYEMEEYLGLALGQTPQLIAQMPPRDIYDDLIQSTRVTSPSVADSPAERRRQQTVEGDPSASSADVESISNPESGSDRSTAGQLHQSEAFGPPGRVDDSGHDTADRDTILELLTNSTQLDFRTPATMGEIEPYSKPRRLMMTTPVMIGEINPDSGPMAAPSGNAVVRRHLSSTRAVQDPFDLYVRSPLSVSSSSVVPYKTSNTSSDLLGTSQKSSPRVWIWLFLVSVSLAAYYYIKYYAVSTELTKWQTANIRTTSWHGHRHAHGRSNSYGYGSRFYEFEFLRKGLLVVLEQFVDPSSLYHSSRRVMKG